MAVLDQPIQGPPSETPDEQTRPGQLPLPEEGMGSLAYWQGEIAASHAQIDDTKLPEWRENLTRYQNKPRAVASKDDDVWVPKDYALTERKRSQLWFAMPELFCQPKPGQSPQTAQAAPVFAAVLNQKLADVDQFDADTVMTEVTFDAICPAGIMVSVLSYEATQDGDKPIQGAPGPPDPLTGQPTPGPVTMAPNIIWEQYLWERVSPAHLVAPADFVGANYDKAPFLGTRFEMDREAAIRRWQLEDIADDVPEGREPLKLLNQQEEASSDRRQRKVLTGVRLEYKASIYDPTVKHPKRLRELVVIDGMDRPVVHRDSPYQTVTETGQLSGDSVLVFTTRVGSPRTIADGKFPMSDCQASRPQTDELSKGRTQMVQQRNRNIPMRAVDKTRVDKPFLDKLVKGEYQEIIPTDGDPNQILVEIAKSQFPRENFTFNQIISQDLEETWAMSANQLGAAEAGQTATEASLKQRNTDARLSKEQQRVKDYAMGCVAVAATLIQRFSDQTDYVEVVGPVGAQILAQSALLTGVPPTPPEQENAADPNTPTTVAWNKQMVQGSFLWTIKPDTQLRRDMTQERQFRRAAYNQYRRDPLVNAQKLVLWCLEAEGLGQGYMAPPAQPQEKPYNISMSFTGEDLIPFAPQYANVVQMLTLEGKPPTFTAAAATPTEVTPTIPHGGPMPMTNPINKRQADQTGNMPGPSGEPNTGAV